MAPDPALGDAPPSAADDQASAPRSWATWPPPGLERIQGDLWAVTVHLAIGATLLTLPLLISLTVRQDFWSLGLFGEAWWILLLTTVAGLLVLLSGYVELTRMLLRWARAADRRYHRTTVMTVLADRRRDAGFLIQGVREYSALSRERRTALLRARRWSAGLLLAAAVWLSAGFVLGVFVAARGGLDERGLAWWTLGPVAAAILAASGLRLRELRDARKARRAWFGRPWSRDLEGNRIESWHEAIDREDSVPVPLGPEGRATRIRALAGGSLAFPLLVLLGGVPLALVAVLGPLLADIVTPGLPAINDNAARSVALADLRVPPDPALSGRQAGEALVALGTLHGAPENTLAVAPLRSYDTPVFPEGTSEEQGGATGLAPARWATELVPRLAEGLEPEAVSYLEEIASHPAMAELRTLAYAPELDETVTWVSPLPEDASVMTLPFPPFRALRELAYAQIGGAVAAAARGRDDDAERLLRELISAGLLLGADGSTLIANVIGFGMAREGGEALAALLQATGRSEDALTLRDELETALGVAQMSTAGFRLSPITSFERMPEAVTDSAVVRGLRWDYFAMLSSLGPCLNLNRTVFGPGDDFHRWTEEARASLVRNSGEEELFELARRGWFGSGRPRDAGILGRLAALTMANDGPGSCAVAFGDMR